MLYMRGVDHQEMRSILQFMYLGEANIKQERTDKFLEFARDLHINEFMSDLIALEFQGATRPLF